MRRGGTRRPSLDTYLGSQSLFVASAPGKPNATASGRSTARGCSCGCVWAGSHAAVDAACCHFKPGMRSNKRMRDGRDIVDIGPDFKRWAGGRARIPFYNTGYPAYPTVFERFGKLRGGVRGFDF